MKWAKLYQDHRFQHYPPISDAFLNKEYFFFIIQMIQLSTINQQNMFAIVVKSN